MAEVAEPAHLVAWQLTVNYFIAIVGLTVSAHFFNVDCTAAAERLDVLSPQTVAMDESSHCTF